MYINNIIILKVTAIYAPYTAFRVDCGRGNLEGP